MVSSKSIIALALGTLAARAANVSVAVGATDPTVGLSPFGAWFEGAILSPEYFGMYVLISLFCCSGCSWGIPRWGPFPAGHPESRSDYLRLLK